MIIADIIALPQYKSLVLDDDVNGSAPSITDLLIHRGGGTYGDHGEIIVPPSFGWNFHFLTLPNSSDLKYFEKFETLSLNKF